MTDVSLEMRRSIIQLAGERGWGETRERWLERAAARAGVSYRTAKSIFYSELRDPRTSVVALVRHAIERKSAIKEESARDEFARLDARMRILERRVDAIDPDFPSAAIDALGESADGTGGEDSPVDSRIGRKR
jgi:hypothetical protein